ncbi:MAG: MFS transporter [Bacillota bacterium]|nr:MFS transporter [Bacillota bacterium]
MNTWKKTFFTIYAGQAFSIIGSSAVQFAMIWYLTELTASAVTLSVAAIFGFLPGLLFSSFAGVYIDRNKKKTVMVIADGGIAVSSAILAVAFCMPSPPAVWLIYAMLFVRGVGSVFHSISMQAAIPLFVPDTELVKAGGWAQFVNGSGNLIGPALGALLMTYMDMAYVMLVDVVGAAFAIICLLLIKIHDPKKTYRAEESPDFWREFKHGLRVLKGNKALYRATPFYVLTGFLYMPVNAMFLLLVAIHYGGTELQAGYVEVAAAVGAIAGSVLIGLCGEIQRKLQVFSFSVTTIGLCVIIIGALPASLFWLCVVFSLCIGIGIPFFNVPFYAFMQKSIPPDELGRVTSLLYMLCCFVNPLGLIIAGPAGDIIGANRLFVGIGILLFLNGLLSIIMVRKPETEYLTSLQREKKDAGGLTA